MNFGWEIIEENRLEIISLCRKHGALNPHVFGSVARGTQRPDSDIDMLVEMDIGRTYTDLIRLQSALSSLLELEVSVHTKNEIHEDILPRVSREAKAV